jgi:hypothetical protein
MDKDNPVFTDGTLGECDVCMMIAEVWKQEIHDEVQPLQLIFDF